MLPTLIIIVMERFKLRKAEQNIAPNKLNKFDEFKEHGTKISVDNTDGRTL